MFEQLKPIEDGLAGLFKSLPPLPANVKKSLVNIFPWLAIIFGILQLWALWALWDLGHGVNRAADYVNSITKAMGGDNLIGSSSLGITYWIAFIFLGLSALTLLMAYPGLKGRKKNGWDWLFIGSLINLVYGVLSIFVDDNYGGGMGNLFSALIGSAISFYLLFQVRERYNGTNGKDVPAEK